MFPDTFLSVRYDKDGRKLGFFYDSKELKVESGLSTETTYKIEMQQQRNDNGDYVLSVKKDGNQIYNKINPSPDLLQSANVFFSGNHDKSLGDAAKIENVRVIKGMPK